MEDNENEKEKKDIELNSLKNLRTNIFYLGNTINDFEMPLYLNEFRTQVKDLFKIESGTNDDISVIYIMEDNDDEKENEKILEAKTDEDYIELLKRIQSKDIKDDTILIESSKIPCEISQKTPETFQEEIACVVESELRSAGEKIKKYLSGNKKCYPLVKKAKKVCSNCYRDIVGNIYRSVTTIEENIYCEKCSFTKREPTFIIH